MSYFVVIVGYDLKFDVSGSFQVFLQVHGARAESRFALSSCQRKEPRQLSPVARNPHSLAATSGGSLDQHRIAEPLGVRLRLAQFSNAGALATRQNRHPCPLHYSTCPRLISHQANVACARTYEGDA